MATVLESLIIDECLPIVQNNRYEFPCKLYVDIEPGNEQIERGWTLLMQACHKLHHNSGHTSPDEGWELDFADDDDEQPIYVRCKGCIEL